MSRRSPTRSLSRRNKLGHWSGICRPLMEAQGLLARVRPLPAVPGALYSKPTEMGGSQDRSRTRPLRRSQAASTGSTRWATRGQLAPQRGLGFCGDRRPPIPLKLVLSGPLKSTLSREFLFGDRYPKTRSGKRGIKVSTQMTYSPVLQQKPSPASSMRPLTAMSALRAAFMERRGEYAL